MKQISKKDLISLITESNQNMGQEMSMDEMAEIKGANPWDANYTGKEANTQVKARYFTRQHGLEYSDLKTVDVFIFNIFPLGKEIMTKKGPQTGRGIDEQGNPKNYRIIVLCHDNLPTISENPEEQSGFEKRFTNWVESMESKGYTYIKRDINVKDEPIGIGKSDFLKDEYGNIKDNSKAVAPYEIYRKSFGIILSKKTGKVNSVSENINIVLMKDIREVMDEKDIVNHLAQNGLPFINVSKNLVYPTHTRRNQGTNVYGSRTNEKIEWDSNGILDPFSSVDEYAQYVNELMVNQGKANPRETKHLIGQYQSGPSRGSFQKDAEIIVENRFSVHGEINGDNGFVWNLHFKASVGKRNDVGLVKYAEAKSETLSDDATPGKDGTVLSNMKVARALRQALEEIKSQLMQVSIEQLYNKSIQAVDGFDEKVAGPQPEDEPELEPQAAGVENPKKGKKITKEAIQNMIKNMLHEAINK